MDSQPDKSTDWKALLVAEARQQGRRYFRLANAILCDPVASEDACQQAFLQAWQRRDAIRDAGALGGWLSRTVVNESYRQLRRREVEQRALGQRAEADSGEDDPVDAIARREELVAALAALAEPTRTVVTLRTMHGMTGGEVSEMLGMSASEVSRRLHHGLDRLREYLRERDSANR